jgi:cytochrome c oxidase cbb3-type subunit 4
MTMNLFHSLWTIVVLITFLGIIFWCYSKNRKSDFEAAANLALEDHLPISTNDAANDVTLDGKKQGQSNV